MAVWLRTGPCKGVIFMNDFLTGLTQPQPEAARVGEQASFPVPNLLRGTWLQRQRRKGLQLRVRLPGTLVVFGGFSPPPPPPPPAFLSLLGWQWGRRRPAGSLFCLWLQAPSFLGGSFQHHCLPRACPACSRGAMGGVTLLLHTGLSCQA